MSDPTRHVELDVDIGADAKDWSAIQATEKLKPVEADLRRMEEMVSEIVSEMDYLRTREQKLRDTNESTNNRVKWFGFCTTFLLIALWVWQVLYLRAYFRYEQFSLLQRASYTKHDTDTTFLAADPSILSKCEHESTRLRGRSEIFDRVSLWFPGVQESCTVSFPGRHV